MENTINQRINQVMDAQRMNVNTFSKALGKSYTALHGIIKGHSKPGYDLLEAVLIHYPETNPTWLITGIGEMITPKSGNSQNDEYLKEYLLNQEANFARLASQLETKDKQIEGLQRTVDALISRPAIQPANFPKPVTRTGKNLPLASKNQIMPITA